MDELEDSACDNGDPPASFVDQHAEPTCDDDDASDVPAASDTDKFEDPVCAGRLTKSTYLHHL